MKTVFEPLLSRTQQEAGQPGPAKDAFNIRKLQHKPKDYTLRRLEHFEILYIKQGPGKLTVDTQKYDLDDNTIYCLGHGQYRSVAPGEQAEGYCISLSQEFLHLSNCMTNYGLSELVMMATPELDHLIDLMYLECLKQDHISYEILRSLLKVFVIICMRSAQPGKDDLEVNPLNEERIVKKFFLLLQRDFAFKKHVAEYADALCLTPNYLNAVVKRQTNFPVSHHIQQHIIMEAKRHAIYSDLRMKDIADRLGFDDCSHFSKFFKAFSGVNFSTFRKGV